MSRSTTTSCVLESRDEVCVNLSILAATLNRVERSIFKWDLQVVCFDEQENYALMAYSSSGSNTEKLKKKKEELKAKVEKWYNSSKNLNILLNSQMSARDKVGLGSSDFNSCESNSSEEAHESMPEPVVNEPKVVSQPKVWTDAPIIEEYESDSDDEHVSVPSKEHETPSFANTIKHVKTPSFSHLIRDCDFHEKRMAKQVELNKRMCKGTGRRENRTVWNNVNRVNHQNQFVPTAVLTRTCKIQVNTARDSSTYNVNTVRASSTKNVSTARHNFNSQAVLTNAARKVNIVKPIMNNVRLKTVFNKAYSPIRSPFNRTTSPRTKFSNQKVNTTEVKSVSDVGGKWETAVKSSADYPQRALQNKEIVDSGCSKHMTRNKASCKAKDFIEFCGSKGIKREYNNARTPQQNGVAKRKNRTLIEAARTMLADSFLPNTFWAEAVSTACYVLNRVLVTKPQNKTPYELVTGKIPIISYIRPFGCHVTILNTIDHLGKFDGKSDEGFLVGYSLQSKAFRVYNLETKRVEENLHITFLENKPNVAGKGPTWLFDLDYLTDSMNYQPVRSENQANKHAGPQEANQNAGTEDNIDAGDSKIEAESAPRLSLTTNMRFLITSTIRAQKQRIKEFAQNTKDLLLQAGAARASSTNTVNTASTPVSTASPSGGLSFTHLTNTKLRCSRNTNLEESYDNPNVEPRKISEVLEDESWVDAMQEELLQFKIQKVWILGHKQEEGIDYDEVFAPMARIEAIRIFLAFASYMGFIVYQMDVKSAFLYGKINEEVYVSHPPGFVDPKYPKKVYKVVKALYGLHQAPRAMLWFSIHLVVYNEELAIPEQTATGKGISNPLMACSLPKTAKPT
ncbi:retrovirus-related pol polyprotein from transposon TNT 1-94 [Tanacetum coccineum]